MNEEFIRIGKYLWQEGLVDSHGGDLSMRSGDKILITRRDAMLGDLKESDIIEVGLEKGDSDALVSREISTHRAIYRDVASAQAIVHAHSPSAVAVSLTDNKIIPQDAEGLSSFKSAAIVRAHQAIGSDEVARLLPSFLQGSSVVAVVKGHGSFAVGKNLEEAYRYTSSLENSCRVLVAMRSTGGGHPPAPKVQPSPFNRSKPDNTRRSAIPPGIGVMDRSRYKR